VKYLCVVAAVFVVLVVFIRSPRGRIKVFPLFPAAPHNTSFNLIFHFPKPLFLCTEKTFLAAASTSSSSSHFPSAAAFTIIIFLAFPGKKKENGVVWGLLVS